MSVEMGGKRSLDESDHQQHDDMMNHENGHDSPSFDNSVSTHAPTTIPPNVHAHSSSKKCSPNTSSFSFSSFSSSSSGASGVRRSRSQQRGSLATILSRSSPFANESGSLPCGEFTPFKKNSTCTTTSTSTAMMKVLVVGAGGLGCEILKDLAMSSSGHHHGMQIMPMDVHVIDLDTIDVTNLNRQFLFRHADVGRSKAETAAAFINARCPWMRVTPHHGRIQDFPPDFYATFQCILSGLDNIEARRWLNATLVGLVEFDDDDGEGEMDPTTIIPMIDGGTEGFSGQARVILPRITSCFECTIDAFPPQTTFPLCTIAETPRRPEHCIAYAYILLWPKAFPEVKLDKDSPEHMQWVYEKALARAQHYHIDGVTYMLTLGVVKNIIPAVASTNAIIAAACVNECIKLLTYCSQTLDSYMMYMGSHGVHSHTFRYEKKDDCIVCAQKTIHITNIPRSTATTTTTSTHHDHAMTLNAFIQTHLKDNPTFRLSSPSIVSATGKTLYMPKPPALEKVTRPNLDLPLSSLVEDGEELTVTDPLLESIHLTLAVHFQV